MAKKKPQPVLNVMEDAPDMRDLYYQPNLRTLKPQLSPPADLNIRNQGVEGACTGFGLSAVINLLYRQQGFEIEVSPRMLYAMAQRYDQWVGEDYEGSSCRGAIKGWRNSGVCLEDLAPYKEADKNFVITADISKDARNRTIGAYYRIRPEISHMHAAINETGVIYVSAAVHGGWFKTQIDDDDDPIIVQNNVLEGGHAFAIVGYNEKGFWVQNSWGPSWGRYGLALWLYEDWAVNVKDAWVVQLALPTPQIFDHQVLAGKSAAGNHGATMGSPPRAAIEDHFVHLDDGDYKDDGRYWSNVNHMELIQQRLTETDFEHFLFYAHGGLNSVKDSAKRIATMKNIFLDNGIYPFHFMYDTGLAEELKDVIFGKKESAETVTGRVSDWFDRRIENLTQVPGRALWREMKRGASTPFSRATSDGSDAIDRVLSQLEKLDRKIGVHVAGHSTGAILQAYMLDRAVKQRDELKISSCTLLAPAATNELFIKLYKPLLDSKVIKDLSIYNLTDKLELGDTVAGIYRKSLLYLVSRSFEEEGNAPILGMEKYNDRLGVNHPAFKFVYSKGAKTGKTSSTSHGGFDNDPNTLNDMMKRILGKKPKRPFTKKDLDY
ncbi:C1 family peptidase [Aurantivibrio infirmus]